MSDTFSYASYFEGRKQAREAVIKQIYAKYYRRKFAAGNFRASWIPDPDKLKALYEAGNEKAAGDTGMLVSINPGIGDPQHPYTCSLQFLLKCLARLRDYRNYLPLDAEFCVEQRGTESSLFGLHVHIAHNNIHGLCKSDFLRRLIACGKLVGQMCPGVVLSDQSFDVKMMPYSAALKYIKKNREKDLVFGLGHQGMIHLDLSALRERICARIVERFAERELEPPDYSEPPEKVVLDLLSQDGEEEEEILDE